VNRIRLISFCCVIVLSLVVGLQLPANAQEATPEPAEGEPVDETINYVTVTPTLILNIGKSQGGRFAYLKTDVALSVKGPAGKAAVEAHMPAVKNILVMGVSGQDEAAVNTAEGREHIRQELAKAIQEFLVEETGKPYVEEVMFTNFIVQL
jgi:flagellar FliL protein